MTTQTAFQARDRLKVEKDAKAASAKLASDALFAASPLPNVGEAIWRLLWEAARKYSDTVAYAIGETKPATAKLIVRRIAQRGRRVCISRRAALRDLFCQAVYVCFGPSTNTVRTARNVATAL